MDFPDSRDGGSSLFLGRVPVKTDWKTDPKSIGQPYLFGGKKEVWLPNRFWKVQFFNQFHQDGGQRCVWDPWKSSRVRVISQIGSNTCSHLHQYTWRDVEHSILRIIWWADRRKSTVCREMSIQRIRLWKTELQRTRQEDRTRMSTTLFRPAFRPALIRPATTTAAIGVRSGLLNPRILSNDIKGSSLQIVYDMAHRTPRTMNSRIS